jgi:predicted translin family RNA/ssDNA-binding protein
MMSSESKNTAKGGCEDRSLANLLSERQQTREEVTQIDRQIQEIERKMSKAG